MTEVTDEVGNDDRFQSVVSVCDECVAVVRNS